MIRGLSDVSIPVQLRWPPCSQSDSQVPLAGYNEHRNGSKHHHHADRQVHYPAEVRLAGATRSGVAVAYKMLEKSMAELRRTSGQGCYAVARGRWTGQEWFATKAAMFCDGEVNGSGEPGGAKTSCLVSMRTTSGCGWGAYVIHVFASRTCRPTTDARCCRSRTGTDGARNSRCFSND